MSQIDLVKFQAVVKSFNKDVIFDFYPSVVPFEVPAEKTVEITDTEKKDDVPKPKVPDSESEEEKKNIVNLNINRN